MGASLQSQLYDVFVGDCREVDLNLEGPHAAHAPAFPPETHTAAPLTYHLTLLHPLSS